MEEKTNEESSPTFRKKKLYPQDIKLRIMQGAYLAMEREKHTKATWGEYTRWLFGDKNGVNLSGDLIRVAKWYEQEPELFETLLKEDVGWSAFIWMATDCNSLEEKQRFATFVKEHPGLSQEYYRNALKEIHASEEEKIPAVIEGDEELKEKYNSLPPEKKKKLLQFVDLL